MGEVYRGRDTRLGRDIAIKVLPQHLSNDPARRERFEREARAVSSLNHPHICVLHDIGSQEGVDYLVMEHIEGETLAARLARGALPIDQVLRHAAEIADALDKAHRQGVVHRDLKPQNVMLTRTGVKLLDFGLAKLQDAAGSQAGPVSAPIAGPGSGGSILPTATRHLTTAGTLLGTFQYMAPEQLEGKEADARTDIFAFGVVVYEMLTGRKAFEGASQASLIAAIMGKDPPPLQAVAPATPPALGRALQRCLAKEPDDRWQSARDLAHELRWVAEAAGGIAIDPVVTFASGIGGPAIAAAEVRGAARAAASRRGLSLPVAAALAIGLAAVAVAATYLLRAPERALVMRVSLSLPPGVSLDGQNAPLAFSPDGRTLAFSGAGEDGKLMLFVRPIDSLQAQPLSGTEGATYPFWSPDGRFIGFFADRKLRKVPAAGGAVLTLCDAVDGRGASWSRNGVIAFAPGPFGGLSQVSEAGGAPSPLTTVDQEGMTHRLPHFLPDGRRLLFLSGTATVSESNGIYSLDLESKKVSRVASENSEGRYVEPGYLIFVRERNLMAQRIDLSSLMLGGEAMPIAEKIVYNPARWTGSFALSGGDLLLYNSGERVFQSQMTWLDMTGRKIGEVGEKESMWDVHLSPDGRRAITSVLGSNTASELWMYDLGRGVGSRFTFGGSFAGFPVWSPDGRQIIYTGGDGEIFLKDASGAAPPATIVSRKDVTRSPTSWSPDGSWVVFWTQTATTGVDLAMLSMDEKHEIRPLLVTPANETDGQLSPDGRWLAYRSDESGRSQLYVTPFPGVSGKWQISSEGAEDHAWLPGGRQIVFRTPANKLMVVDLTVAGTNLEVGAARSLLGEANVSGPFRIAPDGRRILALAPIQDASATPLTLVTNWASALRSE